MTGNTSWRHTRFGNARFHPNQSGRRVLRLYEEGFSVNDIARAFEVPRAAVRRFLVTMKAWKGEPATEVGATCTNVSRGKKSVLQGLDAPSSKTVNSSPS